MNSIVSGAWRGHLGLGLAPRELECTLAVAQGMTAKQIAKALGISPGVVTKRLSNAMFKLQVNRQAMLIAEAMRRQIISPICILLVALIAMHSSTGDMRRDRRVPERRTCAFETKMPRAKGISKARPVSAIA